MAIGIAMSRRGRSSVREYFTSGGTTSWWLLGTSMVATSFAADTPLTLSGWIVTKGIAQNWFWWCQVPITMLGVFFIARLWRRANQGTDTELVDLRYSGRSAQALRVFQALYLSLVYACLVIGWVNLAMIKIIQLAWPDIPRVPFVDTVLLEAYLHTPLSNELPADLRGELHFVLAERAEDVLAAALPRFASSGVRKAAVKRRGSSDKKATGKPRGGAASASTATTVRKTGVKTSPQATAGRERQEPKPIPAV